MSPADRALPPARQGHTHLGHTLQILVDELLLSVWRRLVLLVMNDRPRRADVREKVRIRQSLARSPCSQTVKNSPLSIKITLAEMLANIYTARRVGDLSEMTLEGVRDASPTRRSGGSCGSCSFQPGSRGGRGAAVARAARLALAPARQPAGFLYRRRGHPASTRCW